MSLGLYKRFFFSAMVTASYLLNNIFDIGSAYKDRIRDILFVEIGYDYISNTLVKPCSMNLASQQLHSSYLKIFELKTLQH